MNTLTPSSFEDNCTQQIAALIEVPSYFPFVRTDKKVRIYYRTNGKSVTLSTKDQIATAELYKQFSIIGGYSQFKGELIYMWEPKTVEHGGVEILVPTTMRWEDIELNAEQVHAIAARFEWQKVALSMRLIRPIIVDLFTETFTHEDLQAA